MSSKKPATTATTTKTATKPAATTKDAKSTTKTTTATSSSTPKFTPIISSSRPSVSVHAYDKDAVIGQQTLPAVFISPIRPDIVHFVHTSMAKNSRQAYAVSPGAGHQHSAESWGTGRAVSRVPRVSGGGTGRAGQGAFANSCRKGRMFAPTKTWRRWHRKINVNQKRYAVASALAASALPSLVMARGHKINNVPEIPLVTDNSIESVNKTKQAISALKLLGAYDDVEKSINSKKLRAGVGKMRNRRYTFRRGPLIVYSNDNGITRAFRNLPGVELCHVDALNLLQLAPGGHMGRFIIWTSGAFKRLVDNWGSLRGSSATRVGYRLPRPLMTNSDLTRIINSDEIQSKLRPVIPSKRLFTLHRNPLVNRATEEKLNPYSSALRRQVHASEQARKQARQALLDAKRNKTDSKKPASKPRHTLKQRSKNYSNLVDDHKFELSRANSLSTGGFNVASRNQKEAEQEA